MTTRRLPWPCALALAAHCGARGIIHFLPRKRRELRERHAASLLPHSASKTRVNALMGEKDRMRGFGTRRTICNVRTPSPQPSPLWGEGVRRASLYGLSWQAPPFSRRISAPEFSFARDRECFARLQKCRHVKRETGPVQRRAGVGPAFRSSVTPVSPFRSPDERSDIRERWCGFIAAPRVSLRSPGLRKNEGSGTPANAGSQPPHLAMRRAPFRSAHACRRSTTALTSGNYSIPKHVGRVSRRRNPPSQCVGIGGLRFANPPYVLNGAGRAPSP